MNTGRESPWWCVDRVADIGFFAQAGEDAGRTSALKAGRISPRALDDVAEADVEQVPEVVADAENAESNARELESIGAAGDEAAAGIELESATEPADTSGIELEPATEPADSMTEPPGAGGEEHVDGSLTGPAGVDVAQAAEGGEEGIQRDSKQPGDVEEGGEAERPGDALPDSTATSVADDSPGKGKADEDGGAPDNGTAETSSPMVVSVRDAKLRLQKARQQSIASMMVCMPPASALVLAMNLAHMCAVRCAAGGPARQPHRRVRPRPPVRYAAYCGHSYGAPARP
jgi:hypothetical protein